MERQQPAHAGAVRGEVALKQAAVPAASHQLTGNRYADLPAAPAAAHDSDAVGRYRGFVLHHVAGPRRSADDAIQLHGHGWPIGPNARRLSDHEARSEAR